MEILILRIPQKFPKFLIVSMGLFSVPAVTGVVTCALSLKYG